MLFTTLYNVVDMFFAGLLSTSAQAGLSLGYQAFILAMALGMGLAGAMGALVGGALGAGDRQEARRFSAQGISFGIAASGLMGVAGLWYGPAIISAVSEPGAYREAGIRYFLVLSLALPGFLLAFGCNGILQAHGDGRSMQRAMMAAFAANIVLNPLMIFGLPGVWGGMGFDGLAASTVVSQTGVMIYILAQVLRLRTMEGWRAATLVPRWTRFAAIARQALPIAVAMLVMFFSGFVMQYALSGFGEHAIAGFGIAIRIEQILLLPILGVTGALLPIAAQNFGAGQHDRVRAALFFCWRLGAAMAVAAGLILWLLGGPVLRLFTEEPEVVRVGLSYLRIEGLILWAYMMLFAITSFLQALQRPIWTVWISLYRQGFGIAFFIWLFIGPFGFGEVGVWFGVACAVLSGLVIALVVAARVAREKIGGLWRQPAVTAAG